jgi:hypothetical protein
MKPKFIKISMSIQLQRPTPIHAPTSFCELMTIDKFHHEVHHEVPPLLECIDATHALSTSHVVKMKGES